MTLLYEPRLNIPADLAEILSACPDYPVAESVAELVALSCRDVVNGWQEVAYEVSAQRPQKYRSTIMLIDVRSRGFALTDSILRYVECRMEVSLGWASPRIAGLTVRLEDVNGPHGGSDKLCRVSLSLRALKTVVIESVHSDLYTAIDEAAAKLKETSAQYVARKRAVSQPRSARRGLRVRW